MTIGTKIIKRALRKIQVHTLNSPASPEDIEGAVDPLNGMLELWKSKGIEHGIIQIESAGNEVGDPADLTNAIVSNLALYLADDYEDGQAIVTKTLRDNARRDWEDIQTIGYRTLNIPGKVPSPTLLTGEGNKSWWNAFETFFGPGTTLGGSEGFQGFSGTGGGGGGIPGPPGPPGPQGPPGDEVFANQTEVDAGIVADKSIAPDTLQGKAATALETVTGSDPLKWVSPFTLVDKFSSPGSIGNIVPALLIKVGQLDLVGQLITSTVLDGDIGIIPIGTGRVQLKNFLMPDVEPQISQLLQVTASGVSNWEFPHEVLGLNNGGDMVYNSASDVLTAIPIGAVGQFMESTGTVPFWGDPLKGANKNYIIDGDFSEPFASVVSPADNVYIAPLIHFQKGTSLGTVTTTRDVATTLGATAANRPAAALKITVTTAEATTPDAGHLTLIYDVTGSDYSPLPNRQLVHSFLCRSSESGTFSAAFQNEFGGRTYPVEFTLVANVEKLVELPFVADVTTNWEFTDADIGLAIKISLAAGLDFQTDPSNLNKWNDNNLIASSNQSNFLANNGATFEITHLGLEEGTTARPFIPKERPLVIKQIEWYLEPWDFNSFTDEFAFSGNYESTTSFQFVLPFRTKKRVAPLNGRSKISAASTWNMDVLGTTISINAISIINNSSANSILIEGSSGAIASAGAGCSLKRKATNTAFVVIDSRHR